MRNQTIQFPRRVKPQTRISHPYYPYKGITKSLKHHVGMKQKRNCRRTGTWAAYVSQNQAHDVIIPHPTYPANIDLQHATSHITTLPK